MLLAINYSEFVSMKREERPCLDDQEMEQFSKEGSVDHLRCFVDGR